LGALGLATNGLSHFADETLEEVSMNWSSPTWLLRDVSVFLAVLLAQGCGELSIHRNKERNEASEAKRVKGQGRLPV
jgi:hypothetical protein